MYYIESFLKAYIYIYIYICIYIYIFSYCIYDVTYGFVWFIVCGCLECSCWGGSYIVRWPAIILLLSGCFLDVISVATFVCV
jgi:hypothetical protein